MTVTLTREEAQQVLDLMTRYRTETPLGHQPHMISHKADDAIEILRARLSAPESKPVAWFIEGTFMDGSPSFIQVCETDPEFYTPLYRAPQREWQGLTDEEILEEYRQSYGDDGDLTDVYFARAIEAKLREKNS